MHGSQDTKNIGTIQNSLGTRHLRSENNFTIQFQMNAAHLSQKYSNHLAELLKMDDFWSCTEVKIRRKVFTKHPVKKALKVKHASMCSITIMCTPCVFRDTRTLMH